MPDVQVEKPVTNNRERRRGKSKSHVNRRGVRKRMSAFENYVYTKYSQQPVYQKQRIFYANSFHIQETVEVAMQIGDTPIVPPAVGIGHKAFSILSSVDYAKNLLQSYKIKVDAPAKIPTKTVSAEDKTMMDINTWASAVGNEALAGMFKDIIDHMKGRNSELCELYYWTQVVEEKDFVGYTCELECNGTMYKSNGVMASELQAEQSAAEVVKPSNAGKPLLYCRVFSVFLCS